MQAPDTQGMMSANQQDPQEQFDVFMAYAMKVIHNEKVSDNIAKSLSDKSGDRKWIIDHVARLTLDIILRVESAAADKGIKISDNVKVQATNQVMGEVLNIAQIAKSKKLTSEEKAQSFALCVSLYLDQAVKTGKMTTQELQQIADQLKKTKQGQKIEKTRADIIAKSGKGKQQTPPQDNPEQPNKAPGAMPSGLMAPNGGMQNG